MKKAKYKIEWNMRYKIGLIVKGEGKKVKHGSSIPSNKKLTISK